jgi:hypothetical protein
MPNVSFSSINVVNGQELGDTPQVSTHQGGKRSARGSDMLLIFLDLPGASPSTCADIARTLNDGFSRAPGGVTSALRLAIKLANERVIQLNRGMPPNQRLEGSISCALAGDEGLVIAQAGPTIAYARSASGAFEVIEPYAEGAPQVVGVSATVDVHFNNFAAQPGDVFVLTGVRSCVGATDALINACMAKGDARLVAGYLNANVKQGRMIGMAISMGGVIGAPSAPAPQAEPARAPASAPPAAVMATEAAVAASRTVPPPPPQPAGPSAVSQMTDSVRSGVNQAAKSMQRSLSSFGSKLLPEESPAEVAQRSRTTTFILAAIAILLPIVIGVAVVVGYMQFSGEAERMQLRNTALAQVQAASGSADPAQAKSDWSKALQLIADYEAKNPADAATFNEAKARARTELDRISQVTRVQPLALAQMDGSAARRVAASALGVYVLNPESNTAEYYVLNPERTGTTGKKVEIAFTGGVTQATSVTSNLADIAWATANNDRWRTEGAVMFDTSVIYEYSSATGRAAPIPIPANADATPVKVQAGELFNNTAYLLDSGVGQIWRYPLAGDTLGEGNSYFRSPYAPLKESLDLAIDGAIYVLQKNGSILKYYNRQPVQFTVTGLPEPIKRAAALAVSGPDQFRGSLYILDADNGSVVELSKSGQFVRQYRGPNDEFVDAQDISFDGTSNTLYVATRDRLFSFPVQPPAIPALDATPTLEPTTQP